MKTFDGKVVIVTGGSSGLGEAAALKFAQEGAKVVVAAHREDRGQGVVQKIEESGGDGLFVKTDERWTLKLGQLAKVESSPRKRSLECHGRDGVIPLS